MSALPTPFRFPADASLAARWGELRGSKGPAFAEALAARRSAGVVDIVHPAAVIPRTVAAELVTEVGLEGVEDVMILALDAAVAIARAPISLYRVGVVGLGSRSGDLLLGGNLEFPGASITHTVHAEGFAQLLARARGETLAALASVQARPCAHCRQLLAESAGSAALRLIDPLGHDLLLSDLFPWPFTPGDLGEPGDRPGAVSWPDLQPEDAAVPRDVAAALAAAGQLAHAPYSRNPAAAALRLTDDRILGGSVFESVAFNPTVGPLADALVGVVAAGAAYEDIVEAWLAVPSDAAVNHEAPARDLLAAVAPGVSLHVTYWA